MLHWVLRVAYATPGRTAMLVGVLILLNLAGELALRVRLRPLEAEAQFDV